MTRVRREPHDVAAAELVLPRVQRERATAAGDQIQLELAMTMSIALRFIPTLAAETQKIMKAQQSRGADYDSGSFINKIKGYITVLIPLFVSSFRRADELAVAMDARCYRGGKGRTKLNPLKLTVKDVLTTAIRILSLSFKIITDSV
jgi:energy-coupling factor transport system permease protein